MEIIASQLVFHDYDKNNLNKSCSPIYFKDCSFEWNVETNKYHKYADDINGNDIVISIRDIKTDEDYGFLFFTKKPYNDIFLYTLTKVILDKKLSDEFIRKEIDSVLTTLNNGNYIRNDRLITNTNHPFFPPHVEDTKRKVSDEIILGFVASRDGILPMSQEQEKKYKEIGNKMKNTSD